MVEEFGRMVENGRRNLMVRRQASTSTNRTWINSRFCV